MPPINHIKARVQLECRRQGINIPALAKQLGITHQGLRKILNAKSRHYRTLEKLAGALGITVEQLKKTVTHREYGSFTIPRYQG
jgi:transcriptional regulator with XRE-family HTH domain